jgi:hypothetical protein
MKIQEQLTLTDLPDALRASIEFDAATEILRHLTTLDELDGDEDDDLVEPTPDDRAARTLAYGETAMWF